jgi:hypothetical protein
MRHMIPYAFLHRNERMLKIITSVQWHMSDNIRKTRFVSVIKRIKNKDVQKMKCAFLKICQPVTNVQSSRKLRRYKTDESLLETNCVPFMGSVCITYRNSTIAISDINQRLFNESMLQMTPSLPNRRSIRKDVWLCRTEEGRVHTETPKSNAHIIRKYPFIRVAFYGPLHAIKFDTLM